MEYDELRRLAIRLARRVPSHKSWVECRECGGLSEGEPACNEPMDHLCDCPIASLEAEELADKTKGLKISFGGVEIETVPAWKAQFILDSGDDWSAELTGNWKPISFDMKGGTTWTGWVRSVPTPDKTAGEFEGEY